MTYDYENVLIIFRFLLFLFSLLLFNIKSKICENDNRIVQKMKIMYGFFILGIFPKIIQLSTEIKLIYSLTIDNKIVTLDFASLILLETTFITIGIYISIIEKEIYKLKSSYSLLLSIFSTISFIPLYFINFVTNTSILNIIITIFSTLSGLGAFICLIILIVLIISEFKENWNSSPLFHIIVIRFSLGIIISILELIIEHWIPSWNFIITVLDFFNIFISIYLDYKLVLNSISQS